MAKKLRGPQMILSNRLDDGRVIFMKAECVAGPRAGAPGPPPPRRWLPAERLAGRWPVERAPEHGEPERVAVQRAL